jgi:hypothetical protein
MVGVGADGRSAVLVIGAGMCNIVIPCVRYSVPGSDPHSSGVRLLFGGRVRRSKFDRLFERDRGGDVIAFGEMDDSEVVLRRSRIARRAKLLEGPFEVAGCGICQSQVVVRRRHRRFEPHRLGTTGAGFSQMAESKFAVAQIVERPRSLGVQLNRVVVGAARSWTRPSASRIVPSVF